VQRGQVGREVPDGRVREVGHHRERRLDRGGRASRRPGQLQQHRQEVGPAGRGGAGGVARGCRRRRAVERLGGDLGNGVADAEDDVAGGLGGQGGDELLLDNGLFVELWGFIEEEDEKKESVRLKHKLVFRSISRARDRGRRRAALWFALPLSLT